MGDEMAVGPPERLDAECADAEVTVKGRMFKVRLVERAFAIPAARADPFAAWDTETTLIKYDGSQLEGVTLQVCYLSSRLVHIVPWYAWAAYKLAFAAARPCSEIVMHNAAFDLKVLGFTDDLWLWGEFMEGRVVDTMVRTLHKSQGHGRYMPQLSLKACAKAILRMDLEKDESVRLTHTRDMRYTRQHLEYGAKDAIVTAMIRSALGAPFEENDPGAELLALKGAVALEAVRDNGMLVDSDEYCRMRRMLAENVEHHAEFLREWGVVPGEEGNKAALQRILAKFERKYGFTLPRTEKSGDIQLTDLAMAHIPEDKRHPFMNSWTCYVGVRQILKHFFRDDLEGRGVKVDGGEDADDEGDDSERRVHQDGKIHPRYSWATDTGRTQCSRPNAQNFPRKAEIWLDAMNEKPDITLSVRGYIVASPGCCLNSIDYNQLELCGLAEDCMARFGRSVMAELINAGEDLHTWFAEQIAIARHEHWAEMHKKAKKNMRSLAKVAGL